MPPSSHPGQCGTGCGAAPELPWPPAAVTAQEEFLQAEVFLAGVQQTWRIMYFPPFCKHFFPCLKAVIIFSSASLD